MPSPLLRVSVVAILVCPAPAATADCSALDGVYEYQSVAPRQGVPEYLANFVHGKEKARLYKREGGGAASFGSSAPIMRPKITHLAARVRLEHGPRGTRLHFIDADGVELADLGMDYPGRWSCRGNRLERRTERTGGLGDVINTYRAEETLSVDARGDLVYTETVTRIDPPGGKPETTEATFRRAQALG